MEAAAILKGGDVGDGYFGLPVYPMSVPVSLELTGVGASAELLRGGRYASSPASGPVLSAPGDVPSNNGLSLRQPHHP